MRLTLWWQTGQLGTRMAASTPSSRQRARISGGVDLDRVCLAAIGRRAVEALREAHTGPLAAARRKAGSGNQVPLSSMLVCLRSMATCAMRRSWSTLVSPEYTV